MKVSIRCYVSISVLIPVAGIILTGLFSSAVLAKDVKQRAFQPADVQRLKDVGDIALSADGEWLAYRVATTDVDADTHSSNLFMVNRDGSTRIQLTYGKEGSESHPRFSPDGKYLAFIAARGDSDPDDSDEPADKAQVWLLNRAGGEAERLTGLAGGVTNFEWSPDSTRLVLVASDPEKKVGTDGNGDASDGDATDGSVGAGSDQASHAATNKGKQPTPKPIVIDRYKFKQDVRGYLVDRYQRLYLFDLATRQATLLTPGAFDSSQPAWAPGSDVIAFSSQREGDPDRNINSDIYVIAASGKAQARRLTKWKGPDSAPVFSPDGLQIAYLQGGPPKYSGYDPAQLAVISIKGGEPTLPTANLDRSITSPRWSPDGESLYFLVADDRVRAVERVPIGGGEIERVYPAPDLRGVVRSFEVDSRGLVSVTSFGQRPAEIYRSGDGAALSDHNRELRTEIAWATVEGFDSVNQEGLLIGSMLLKPPGFRDGVAYPTIAYVHGGPVGQDGYEFDVTSQVLAAQGYLVVNPNYRGSSGRGRDYSRAIYADWGNLEIQDIHTVMDHLVETGLADPKRLGIGGWSYGGMSTNYAIATDTRFSAAVSGASISNILSGYGTDQYIWQYENEIGLPWESLDAYLKISYPFLHADRIKTPTLFMCGEKDFNVPLINSEQMYQALRSLNVPTRLVIYPGQFHGLRKPSYIRDRLERMLKWYGKYLGRALPTGEGQARTNGKQGTARQARTVTAFTAKAVSKFDEK